MSAVPKESKAWLVERVQVNLRVLCSLFMPIVSASVG